MANDAMAVDVKDEVIQANELEIEELEWSADQEILLLYSLHGYKPVGPNKHFRMLIIQDRLSNAMNKNISSAAIWKKLNVLYDLEALDEAEAEADAAVAVDSIFSLPDDEFGELMANKLRDPLIKLQKQDYESENDTQGGENIDLKADLESEVDAQETETSKVSVIGKDGIKKEPAKRGPKRKDLSSVKEVGLKKEINKDVNKKDATKKEGTKDIKKVALKEDERKDIGKKGLQELKRDTSKESKREHPVKISKRELPMVSDSKKDDTKKPEQKKIDPKNVRGDSTKPKAETPKQLRNETPKKTEIKSMKVESTKSQKLDSTPNLQKIEPIKKDLSGDKKRDITDRKIERKSPEKTPENSRSTKLRAREKKDIEADKAETPTGLKRERSRDSTTKAETLSEEPAVKKAKTSLIKSRPTRNSLEPAQKSTSPCIPQKRRTRLL